MKPVIHILQKKSRIASHAEEIERRAVDVIEKIEHIMPLPPLDVVIGANHEGAIPETGIGGSSPDAHVVLVWIDPDFKDITHVIENDLPRTIAHECHHAARGAVFPWKDATLLEAFVAEGLADHFDIEVNGGKPYPWSVALSDADSAVYLKKAQASELLSKQYDHASWFFGSQEKNIPRWTGYAVGFKIVSDYMLKTGKKASELVAVDAKEFIM